MEENVASRDIFAMDTFMMLKAYGEQADSALDDAIEEIERLDALLSTGSADSEISGLNQTGHAVLSDDAAYLTERSLEVYEMSDGAFDPLIYPLMEAWGFTDQQYKIPDEETINSLLSLTDIAEMKYDAKNNEISFLLPGMELDFGGIAKGYTSSRVTDLLREQGILHAVISLGGNVQVLGTKPDGSLWKVAIRDPIDSSRFLGILETTDRAVITSGGYERYFELNGETYHHILDPSDGYPADSGLLSVTIVSKDGTLADGLSTALFVFGAEKAKKIWRENRELFDMILLTTEYELYVTEGIAESFSSSVYPVRVISSQK